MKEFVYVFGVRVSTQSFVIAAAGSLFSMIALYIYPQFFNYIVLIYASFLIQAYNVNCTIVGQCKEWATILMIIFCLKLLYIVMVVSKVGPGLFSQKLEELITKRNK